MAAFHQTLEDEGRYLSLETVRLLQSQLVAGFVMLCNILFQWAGEIWVGQN